MTDQRQSEIGPTADLIDVHLLDIAAQIEALLRGVRDAQHTVLRLRGSLPPAPSGESPANALNDSLRRMLLECAALRDAVETAIATASMLTYDAVEEGQEQEHKR